MPSLRLVRVRDEDLDWEIYHTLLYGRARTTRDLEAAGFDPAMVDESLSRLEGALLIERRGDAVRPLTFQEAILRCRLKNEKESPLVFKDGVVRVRKEEERNP